MNNVSAVGALTAAVAAAIQGKESETGGDDKGEQDGGQDGHTIGLCHDGGGKGNGWRKGNAPLRRAELSPTLLCTTTECTEPYILPYQATALCINILGCFTTSSSHHEIFTRTTWAIIIP
nr:hypothetical protein CFP56_36299 [Quercus suber]